MSKPDPTKDKIRAKIEEVEAEIKAAQTRLAAFKELLEDEETETKPDGFVLTKELKKVMQENGGTLMFIDQIIREIAKKWGGYKPLKRSVQITLNGWAKSGKVKKDENRQGHYEWIIPAP